MSSISLMVFTCLEECTCAQWCVDWGVWWSVHDQWCVLWLKVIGGTCGWLHGLAIHMCASLPFITNGTHNNCPLSVAQHRLVWSEDRMICQHAFLGCFVTTPFSLSNHNCLLFFSKPSFLLKPPLPWMLGDEPWGVFDGYNKRLIPFLLISVVNCLSASILWCLDGTILILYRFCVLIFDVQGIPCVLLYHDCDE